MPQNISSIYKAVVNNRPCEFPFFPPGTPVRVLVFSDWDINNPQLYEQYNISNGKESYALSGAVVAKYCLIDTGNFRISRLHPKETDPHIFT